MNNTTYILKMHRMGAAALLILLLSPLAEAKEIAVGFWENSGVRKVFEFKNSKWHSSLVTLQSTEDLKKASELYKSPSRWTLFFDGKTYGEITTTSFGTYSFYKENGLQKVISKEPSLSFRKLDDKFSNWEGKNIRPVLVSNLSDVTDPDLWKTQNMPKFSRLIFDDLKARTKGKLYACKSSDCKSGVKEYKLKISDVVSVGGYRNQNKQLLQAIEFKFAPGSTVHCEFEGDQCQNAGSYWFLILPNKKPIFFTQAAALIETADLNQDGVSDFLFWINEYNLNGYELIDGKTFQSVRSTWFYH